MAFVSRRRVIAVGVVLGLAIVVGVLFGYLAGVAVVLAAITIPMLLFGPLLGVDAEARAARKLGRNRFGSDEDGNR
jgi:hypothetical protein